MIKGTFSYVSAVRMQGREEGRAEGRAEGRIEGLAEAIIEAIIAVLSDRGIAMQDADRERILSCPDADTLRTWLRRALRASTVGDLFTD